MDGGGIVRPSVGNKKQDILRTLNVQTKKQSEYRAATAPAGNVKQIDMSSLLDALPNINPRPVTVQNARMEQDPQRKQPERQAKTVGETQRTKTGTARGHTENRIKREEHRKKVELINKKKARDLGIPEENYNAMKEVSNANRYEYAQLEKYRQEIIKLQEKLATTQARYKENETRIENNETLYNHILEKGRQGIKISPKDIKQLGISIMDLSDEDLRRRVVSA